MRCPDLKRLYSYLPVREAIPQLETGWPRQATGHSGICGWNGQTA